MLRLGVTGQTSMGYVINSHARGIESVDVVRGSPSAGEDEVVTHATFTYGAGAQKLRVSRGFGWFPGRCPQAHGLYYYY
jgi:hypothetical protein